MMTPLRASTPATAHAIDTVEDMTGDVNVFALDVKTSTVAVSGNEDPAIVADTRRAAAFRGELELALRAAALEQLDGIRGEVDRRVAQLVSTVNQSNPSWVELQADIAADRELFAAEQRLAEQLTLVEATLASFGGDDAPDHVVEAYAERREQVAAQLSRLREVRTALRVDNPALGLVDAATLPEGASRAQIAAHVRERAAALHTQLDDVGDRIRSGDIPLTRLDRLVPRVVEALSTTEERTVGFERALRELRSDERMVEVGTTTVAIVAGIAAAAASGGTALALGLIGAAAGVAGAAHDLEIADDLVDASEASLTGPDAMVGGAAAKAAYRAAMVNLVLAATDAVLAGRALRGLRVTALAKAPAEVMETLARLSPKQLKLVQRAAAADPVEAERLMAKLADQLDPRLFARAREIVQARRTARAALPQLDAAVFDELYASLGPQRLERWGRSLGAERLAGLEAEVGAERLARTANRYGERAFVRVASTVAPKDVTRLLRALGRTRQPLDALLRLVDPGFLLARLDEVGARVLAKQIDALGPKGMAHAIEAMGEDGAAAWLRSKPSGASMNRLARARSALPEGGRVVAADPARAVLGPGRLSHPVEWNATIERLRAAGVEVELRPGGMAYGPRPSGGRPGRLILDPHASIAALKHEYRHFLDDQAAGFLGMGRLLDPDVRLAMERRAYDVEIRYIREEGFEVVAKQLEENFEAERAAILRGATP